MTEYKINTIKELTETKECIDFTNEYQKYIKIESPSTQDRYELLLLYEKYVDMALSCKELVEKWSKNISYQIWGM